MFAKYVRRWGALGAVMVSIAGPVLANGTISRHVSFGDLPGWQADRLDETLSAFRKSCKRAKDPRLSQADWAGICATAAKTDNARAFFETHFQPVRLTSERPVLFTGYYEPELLGSRQRGGQFQHPIYRKPNDWNGQGKWRSRAEIDAGAMQGKGLELAWLTDPVEAYFLHIQGSGRIRLAEGGVLRAGFSASNGHKYRSIGTEMIRRGIKPRNGVTARGIKQWVRENPKDGRALLHHNPRYIFFREVTDLPDSAGPIGAMSIPLSTMRSMAVDPKYIPLGSPVWIDKQGGDPVQRLMIAQDVGAAIKGPHRADIFYGSGQDAGHIAGRTKSPGAIYVLLPKKALGSFAPRS
jgi:membrane-bound lytic murein transglycosylase A